MTGLDADADVHGQELHDQAMEHYFLHTAAELFGRDAGYCRGRGSGMHIADFSIGHLGANAIVGGGMNSSNAGSENRNSRLLHRRVTW